MENTSPQYVQGYYRNKTQTENKTESGAITAAVLIAGSTILMAAVFWQATLALSAAAGAGYGINKYLQYKKSQLIINR